MFPGALCASGRPERSFQLNTRIEARDSCVPGTMARQPFRGEGEPPKEQPPAWAAYPGPWENILRTVTKFVERYPDASSSGGCVRLPCALFAHRAFCFPQPVSVCRSGGPAAEHRRRNSMKKRLRQDRGGKPVLQYGMVPAAAAHCHHAGAHHKRGVFFTVYRHCCGRPAVCEFQL